MAHTISSLHTAEQSTGRGERESASQHTSQIRYTQPGFHLLGPNFFYVHSYKCIYSYKKEVIILL